MKGTRPTLVKFTVFAVVSVLLFVGLFRMMSNSVPGGSNEWHARFTVVSGLRAGDDVRVAGVKVGRVERVELTGDNHAEVSFTLRKDQVVYDGTRLTLRYQNLLGQRYLALSVLDRDRRLRHDTVIPSSHTSPGFDLTALLNGFEPLFSVLEPGEVNKLASNIVAVLQGESGTVESLLRHTAEATSSLADREELFDQVLDNLTPVLRNLDAQSSQFDATVVQFRKLMTGLARQRDTFTHTIDHLGGLVDSTSSLLRELRPDVRRDVHSLRRTTGLLARERPRLAQTVDNLPALLGAFARSMSFGGYLSVYLCNLGLEAGGQEVWFGGNGRPALAGVHQVRAPLKGLGRLSHLQAGVVALVALTLVAGLVTLASTLNLGSDGYTAQLQHTGGLRVGEEVQVAGVGVGKVTGIELGRRDVLVHFTVDDDVRLGRRTTAEVKVATLLGTHFMLITPRGGGSLADDTIPLAQTRVPFNLQDVIDTSVPEVDEFDPALIERSLGKLAETLDTSGGQIGPALDGVRALSTLVATRSDEIGKLLVAARRVTGQLNSSSGDVLTLMKQADVILDALRSRRTTVHALLQDLASLGQQLGGVLEDTRADIKPTLRDLDLVIELLEKHDASLDKAIKTLAPAARYFANAGGNGSWLDQYTPGGTPDNVGCVTKRTCR